MNISMQEKLVKHSLVDLLRTEIMNGALASSERIIEDKWAAEFEVAQGYIREAINILAYEGFVTKRAGRSARVIHFTERAVLRLYEVRGALEGLAAHLVAHLQADISALQFAIDGMRQAAQAGHREAHLDCDLQFHLQLCEISGNLFLVEQSRRILLPFFAFVRIRVSASSQDTAIWCRDLEAINASSISSLTTRENWQSNTSREPCNDLRSRHMPTGGATVRPARPTQRSAPSLPILLCAIGAANGTFAQTPSIFAGPPHQTP